MADTSLVDIKAFFDKLDPSVAQNYLQQLAGSSSNVATALQGIVSTAGDVGTAFTKMSKEGIAKLNDMKNSAMDFFHGLNLSKEEVRNLATLTIGMGVVLTTNLKSTAFTDLRGGAQGLSTDLGAVTQNIGRLTGVIKAMPGMGGVGTEMEKLARAGALFASQAQLARDFEANLMAASNAAGTLGDLLAEIGPNMTGLTDKSVKYAEMISEIGDKTGKTSGEISKYAEQLRQIPGALRETVDLTEDGKTQMSELTAAIKIASGTGQTFDAVFRDMNQVYQQFGTTGKSALEYVASLSAAAQDLKMPMQFVRDYTQQAAMGFRFLGDNSQAAINVLERFGPALKAGGLGPKAIADLTAGVMKGVADMGLAQQAFLSSTTGGKGGLQGAFQIDLLKKQGKADEVQKLMEESLKKQMGGRIVTLEEGAQGGAAAAQLAKQIQLMTTGPTKMANTREEAYALLEVFSKGGMGKAVESKKPEDVLQKTVETGTKWQERNYNAATKLNNIAEKQLMFLAIQANNAARLVSGQDSPLVKQFMKEEMRDQKREGKIIEEDKLNKPKSVDQAMIQFYQNIQENAKKLKETGSAGIDNALTKRKMETDRKAQENMLGVKNPMIPGTGVTIPTEPRPLLSSNKRVSNDLLTSRIEKETGPNADLVRNKPGGAATVQIQAVCAECNKKIAKATTIEIIDGKIAALQKDQINHAHGSY